MTHVRDHMNTLCLTLKGWSFGGWGDEREEGVHWTGRGICAVGIWTFQSGAAPPLCCAGEEMPAPSGGFTCPRSHSNQGALGNVPPPHG